MTFCVTFGRFQAFASELSPFVEKPVEKVWKRVGVGEYSPSVSDYFVAYLPSERGYLINDNTMFMLNFPFFQGKNAILRQSRNGK